MRPLVTLTALFTTCWIVSTPAQQPFPQPINLDVISWLLGEWAFTNGPTTTGENWQRTSATTWEGSGFVVREGDTTRTEDLRLLAMQGEIFYLSKVDHNALPVAFKLMTWSDTLCVFENSGHDFPQRIVYCKTEDGLTARIEGITEGKERTVAYPYSKASRTPKLEQASE